MADAVRSKLRDVVFGLQDGLISTLGALTGIAEGTRNPQAVAVAGWVIIAVESLSMAAGSYLSSKSHRQYLERLLKEEADSIETNPEGERRELWEMYRQRGYHDEEIAVIEKRLFKDKHLLLEDMAHKELGISPTHLEEPLGNAVAMGLSYVVGGAVPVLPYLLLPLGAALPVSFAAAALALFLLGGLKGKIVRLAWWRSGGEMLAVAGLAALVGFVIGRLARLLMTPGPAF